MLSEYVRGGVLLMESRREDHGYAEISCSPLLIGNGISIPVCPVKGCLGLLGELRSSTPFLIH